MRDPNTRAALTAALLNRSDADRRVERCLISANVGPDHVGGTDARLATVAAPLLCEKGAASAGGFDPLIQVAAVDRLELIAGRRVRVWFRIDPARRLKLKQSAGYRRQSCQAFLVSAVDGFMRECASIPDAAAASLAMITKAAPRQTSNGRRHKIAIWIPPERREQIRAMTARLGQTIQAFLVAALDEYLDRMVRSERALSRLFEPIVDASDYPIMVKPSQTQGTVPGTIQNLGLSVQRSLYSKASPRCGRSPARSGRAPTTRISTAARPACTSRPFAPGARGRETAEAALNPALGATA